MINAKKLEDIAQQISEAVPPGIKTLANDFDEKVKQILQAKLSQLDFVSREEFDVQTQVLVRTREKLTALEEKVAELEKQFNEKA
jgi:BMFP domain-containing protein YqiC